MYDYSGYGNDGTITDGYTSWVTGYNDTLGFRMNSWLLEIPSTASLETLNGDMSVNFMWYNGQSGEDQDLRRPFLRKGDESDAMDFNIRIESGLRIGGYGGDQTGWGFDGESRVNGTWPHWLSPNSQTFQYRDWHMVTLVREGGEGRAYEDGQLIYSFSGDDPGYMDPTSYPMYLGLTDVSKDNDVIVDELAIYSGVLTNSEIEDLWATLSGGIGGGLGDGGCLLCGGGGGEAL